MPRRFGRAIIRDGGALGHSPWMDAQRMIRTRLIQAGLASLGQQWKFVPSLS